jgi:diamine N-acetyltransferase
VFFLKESNIFIGTIRIGNISSFHYFCTIGVCFFNKKYWRKGYALESIRRVVKFVFDDLQLHYIYAGVYKRNSRSLFLFRKAGFKQVAGYKNRYRFKNTFADVISFAKVNRNFDRLLLQKNKKVCQ